MSQTPPAILIRPATDPDLPEVHRMLIALAAHHGDQATIPPATLRALILGNPNAQAFVAQVTGSPAPHPVGYALLLIRLDPISGAPVGDLAQLFVQAPFRRRGIGRALIAAVRQAGCDRGLARLVIGTHPENGGAARSYRAMGLAELPAPGPRFAVPLG